MQTRPLGVILFILLLLVSVPLVQSLLQGGGSAATPVDELAVGQGRSVHISSALVLSRLQGLYYEVREGDEVVQPPAFFGSLTPVVTPPKFVAYTAEDGNLVGIAAAWSPQAILILHDFESGESWPKHGPVETVTELAARGQRLFERLAAEHPAEGLRLEAAEGMRPLTEPAQTQPAGEGE